MRPKVNPVKFEEKDGKTYVSLRPVNPRFRALLSIDGGGVRGIIPAKVLEGFEKYAKEVAQEFEPKLKDVPLENMEIDITETFDMVAGNSAGSILALYFASGGGRPELYEEGGMLEGLRPGSASAALQLVDNLVNVIFKRHFFHPGRLPLISSLTGILFSKYGNKGLQTALDKIFGEMTMRNLQMNAYVPAYELDNSRPVGFYARRHPSSNITMEAGYSFPSGAREEEESDGSDGEIETLESSLVNHEGLVGILPKHFETLRLNLPVKIVAQASSSAPVYFANTRFSGRAVAKTMKLDHVNWVDGGVVSNNPTMQALAFLATCFADRQTGQLLGMSNMAVLSIGTGARRARAKVGRGRQGIVWWGSSLVSILMDSHTEINHKIIDALFDGALFGPSSAELDRYVRINKIVKQGEDDYDTLGALDSVAGLKDLKRIGKSLADENEEMLKNFIRNILMADADDAK